MVGQEMGQRQIMGHDDLCHAAFIAQAFEFFGHLQLDRGVQRAGRLVTEQDLLLQQQCQRQRYALVHAAAESEGAFPQDAPPVAELDLGESLRHLGVKGFRVIFSVTFERFDKLLAIAADGVEGRLRRLEDDAHFFAAELVPLLWRKGGELRASKTDRAGEKPDLGCGHQGLEHGALTAAALPHEAEDLAPLQGKGHVRGGRAVAVSDTEPVESEDRVAHVSASFASSASRTQSPK